MKFILKKLTLISIILITFSMFAFGQTNSIKGIELYQNGDYQKAIETLEKSNGTDIVAQYYLALSYEKVDESEKFVRTFESAVNECVKLILNEAEKINDSKETEKPSDYIELIGEKLKAEIAAAGKSFERLSELNKKKYRKGKWETNKDVLETFSDEIEAIDDNSTLAGEDRPLKVTKPSFPSYTYKARNAGTTGKVRLLVAFSKTGKIGFVIPLSFLPDGLTERAVEAAKKIKFKPAIKDGKPISVVKRIEYTFEVY